MSWSPKYSACFEGPIIDNILTIITRDMRAALDYFNPAEASLDPSDPLYLRDFAERSIGTQKALEFPTLIIGPRTNAVETVDDDSNLIEPMVIQIDIGITDVSADAAMRRIMKYVRALDAVLRTASQADYLIGMASSTPFALQVEVTHNYGPLGANDNRTTYFKPASLELSLNFRER